MINDKRLAVIETFSAAIESISFSLKLSQLILNKHITFADFNKDENLPNFIKELDWSDNPKQFIEQAEWLPLMTVAFWMTACEEGYFDLTQGKFIDKNENADLYAAQKIFRIIRNSFGHPYTTHENQVKIRWNMQETKYRKKYEVKELGIVLDATNLHEKDFKMTDVGGWENFFKILKYLQNLELSKLRAES